MDQSTTIQTSFGLATKDRLPSRFIKASIGAAFALALLLGAGCATTATSRDPVAQFREKHPSDAAKYVYIYPISTDTYVMIAAVQTGTILEIAHTLREKFPAVPEVVHYADDISKQEQAATQSRTTYFESFRLAGLDGGTVCEFQSYDGKTTDLGLLVLKAGEIVKRDVWRSEQGPPKP